jgi:hypothetical protein
LSVDDGGRALSELTKLPLELRRRNVAPRAWLARLLDSDRKSASIGRITTQLVNNQLLDFLPARLPHLLTNLTHSMADRFPSLDEIDAGKFSYWTPEPAPHRILNDSGHTEARGPATDFELVGESNDTDDFLSRERALLGDDADQFASENDKLATVEDGDDDLLGGDFSQANVGGQEMDGFESSFPAIDTTNEVSTPDIFKTSCFVQHRAEWQAASSPAHEILSRRDDYSSRNY